MSRHEHQSKRNVKEGVTSTVKLALQKDLVLNIEDTKGKSPIRVVEVKQTIYGKGL